MTQPGDLLRRLFVTAVAAADPAVSLARHLPEPPRGRTIVVGAGKAAASMARAVEAAWPGDISGLVVTRYAGTAPQPPASRGGRGISPGAGRSR